MKTLIFLLLTSTISLSSIAQDELSEGVILLFKNVKTKLTDAEKNEIYTALGFMLTKDKTKFVDKTDKDNDFPYDVSVYPTDLNKDGKEEIFVLLGNSALFGMAGATTDLFIKDATGKYILNSLDGMLPLALTTANLGYPDLLPGVPGMELPEWRWNGKQYKFYKNIPDSAAQKMKTTNIEDLSKAYTKTIK